MPESLEQFLQKTGNYRALYAYRKAEVIYDFTFRFAYLRTPHGFGPSKMREKFDEWIGVTYTARNWNTVLKLAELGRAAEA